MCNHFATAPFQLVNQIFEFGDMLVSLGSHGTTVPEARLFCTSMVLWLEEPLKRRVTSFFSRTNSP